MVGRGRKGKSGRGEIEADVGDWDLEYFAKLKIKEMITEGLERSVEGRGPGSGGNGERLFSAISSPQIDKFDDMIITFDHNLDQFHTESEVQLGDFCARGPLQPLQL